MVNTAISHISSEVVQNKASAHIVSGRLTADSYPGQAVVLVSGKWVKADSDTAAHKLLNIGIIVWRARINNAGASVAIDSAYDIDPEPMLDVVGICVSGFCACFITDQGTTLYPLQPLMVSATAGSLTIYAIAATGALSGTAMRQIAVATLAKKVVSGDTVAFVGIGEFYGRVM